MPRINEAKTEMQDIEFRLFGNVFRLQDRVKDEALEQEFYKERLLQIKRGEQVWLPRDLDGVDGVLVDLYKHGQIMLTLSVDYAQNTGSVYLSGPDGRFANQSIISNANISDAVVLAEQYFEG